MDNQTEIINQWIKEGIKLNPPATINQIVECETILDFTFPEDFRVLYSICNGFEGWIMDSKFLSLWPLEKVLTEYDSSHGFVAFCDFLINSHQIGFMKLNLGIYKDYDESRICETFNEFLYHWNNTAEYM